MSRSPSRDRSASRAGRTLAASSGGGGGGDTTTYQDAVLTDTPWGFWRLTETSGTTLADSSGNTRPMTTFNGSGGVLLNQTGPYTALPAIQPTGTAGAGTAATSTASTVTMECWLKIPTGTISAANPVFHMQQNSGTYDKLIWVGTDGKIYWDTFAGSQHLLSTTAAVARDTWHHVVGSIGPAGQKLRVNKVTVATDPATTSYTGAQAVYIKGTNNTMGGGYSILVAACSLYLAQLTDTRTDAHYDAAPN